MQHENDEPAFPQHEQVGEMSITSHGMILRDYFAAKAMQGILSSLDSAGLNYLESGIASSQAYAIADAMLKERAK